MSLRTKKVNELVKRKVGEIILREISFPPETLVTVTRVDVPADLSHADVYISVIPGKNAEEVLDILSREIYDIQQELNKKLSMKIVPRIQFVEERETEAAARVEELLESVKDKDEK